MATGTGIPCPHRRKILIFDREGDDDIKIDPRVGMATGVNFHPVPVPASPLLEIFPSPPLLSRFQLRKNLHLHFFLLNFGWILLCIVKIVLHKLVKL